MNRCAIIVIALLATACSAPAPEPAREPVPAPAREPAVVRRPAPAPSSSPAPLPGTRPPLADARTGPVPSGVSAPAGALYVCVTDTRGERRQVAIEFEPKVHALCARHPEMGPCQYERDHCRQAGGRVFDADGREVTAATEAEYDRKVMRFRLRSN